MWHASLLQASAERSEALVVELRAESERLTIRNAELSAQLSQLSRAGLITGRREGRSIIYSVNFDAIGGLILFLLEDCCNGRSEVQTRILAAITDVCRDDKDCLDMADAVQMKKVQDE